MGCLFTLCMLKHGDWWSCFIPTEKKHDLIVVLRVHMIKNTLEVYSLSALNKQISKTSDVSSFWPMLEQAQCYSINP